ncbi:MAG: hypothetical protein ACRC5A_09165 [Enterobacteriaceae bacterium]
MKIHPVNADAQVMLTNAIDFSQLVFSRSNGKYLFNNLEQQIESQLATANPFKTDGKIDFTLKDIQGQSHAFSINVFDNTQIAWATLLNDGNHFLHGITLIPAIDHIDLTKKMGCSDVKITGNYNAGYLLRLDCTGGPQYLNIKNEGALWGTVLFDPDTTGHALLQRMPLAYYPLN